MGKKHKHPEHENLERWLVSYADFITLLFATFVVLYALSQVDLAKFKQMSVGIQAAFSTKPSKILHDPGGVMKGSPDAKILPKSGNSILDKISPKEPGQGGTAQGAIQPVVQAVQAINKEIEKINQSVGAKSSEASSPAGVKIQERGIVISFASSLFFEPGSAGIKPTAYPVLDKVADLLKDSGRVIHVEGHTDSQTISSAVYPSNWELSTARASSVVRYFTTRHHFDPTHLAAVGYADTRPVAANDTPDGRAKNRRVDLVILFSSAVKDADAGAAQEGEETVQVLMESEGEGVGTGFPAEGAKKPEEKSAAPPPIQSVKPAPLAKPTVLKPIQLKPELDKKEPPPKKH